MDIDAFFGMLSMTLPEFTIAGASAYGTLSKVVE